MKKIFFNFINCILFLILTIFAINQVSEFVKPYGFKPQIALYEAQDENSIDLAFIGSSSTYRYYDIMSIWENHGITSMNYTIGNMPFEFLIPLLEMAQTNQSPEVFVIDLRCLISDESKVLQAGSFERQYTENTMINAVNLLPLSDFKYDFVTNNVYLKNDSYLYLFNILKNHSNFTNSLNTFFNGKSLPSVLDFKGNSMTYFYQDLSSNSTAFPTTLSTDYELSSINYDRLLELFDYIDENELNVLFTFTPYLIADDHNDLRLKIGEIVLDNGYDFIDFLPLFHEIGLDSSIDFYDEFHTNAKGARKYSIYATQYIKNLYNLSPNYSENVINDWNYTLSRWKEQEILNFENFTQINDISEASLIVADDETE